MTEKSAKPQLRFAGFDDTWEQRKVTELGKIYIGLVTTMTKHYTNEGTLLIRNSDIKDGRFEFGDTPIYLEKAFAQENESRMHQIGDVITVHTGDVGTSAVITENEAKSIGFATIVTRPDTQIIDPNYLCSFLNTDKHKRWAVAISTGDGRTNYNLGDYYELVVPVPSIKEQQAISSFVQNLNNLITLHQRKYNKLTNVKKSMLEKMFPKNGSNVPEIRFKGFSDAWEQRKLGEVAIYRRGSFPQPYGKSEWYDGDGAMPFVQVADVSDEMNLVEDTKQKISILAQPMSVFAEKNSVLVTLQGSIGRVAITQYGAFVDRTVLIFEKYKAEIDKTFWAYIIKQKFIDEARKAPGGTIKTITKEALSDFELSIPNYQEQKQIGAYFRNLDDLITLHQRELEKLKNLKKACLEKMFV